MSLARLAVFVLITAACSKVTVQSDFDPSAAFASYKTFDWRTLPDTITQKTAASSANAMLVNSPRLNQAIKNSVEQELGDRGINYTPGQETDLHAVYYLNISTKSETTQWLSNEGQPYNGWNPGNSIYGYDQWKGGATTGVVEGNASQSLQGTLVIDIIDVRSNTLVWRGMGSGAVKADQPGAKAPDAVKKIMKSFPPK
jgi:hypothetical protein